MTAGHIPWSSRAPWPCASGAGAEYPVWRDFILALDVKYMWLNFDKMRKKLSQTSELILLDSVEGDPVQLDLSGPRAVLSIKHYFTL